MFRWSKNQKKFRKHQYLDLSDAEDVTFMLIPYRDTRFYCFAVANAIRNNNSTLMSKIYCYSFVSGEFLLHQEIKVCLLCNLKHVE